MLYTLVMYVCAATAPQPCDPAHATMLVGGRGLTIEQCANLAVGFAGMKKDGSHFSARCRIETLGRPAK